MGKQPQARKKRQVNRHKPRLAKTKNYRQKNLKDLDEVHDTIKKLDDKQAAPKLEVNEDLPGLGQFHCVECRWVSVRFKMSEAEICLFCSFESEPVYHFVSEN